MCDGRDHRYSVRIDIDDTLQKRIEVYAKGLSVAVAKADGWVAKHYPHAEFVDIHCFRVGYGGMESTPEEVLVIAAEHGAIIQ